MTGKFDESHTHVFGPVPSRRLGRSLGVDIVPYKVCSQDCIYCQVGRTTENTTVRRDFVDVDGIVEEIRRKLADCPRPDYITLAGSGEPTLHSEFGRLIEGIKSVTDVPVSVLTNGTLLSDPMCAPPAARPISSCLRWMRVTRKPSSASTGPLRDSTWRPWWRVWRSSVGNSPGRSGWRSSS